MKFKKVIVTLIGVFFIAGFSSQAMAAFEPGDDDNLVGPVLWAVGVINCSNGCTGTLRVKMVDDCNVSTQAVDQTAIPSPPGLSAPEGSASVLNVAFPTGTFLGYPCPAKITKVKNWWQNDPTAPTLWSFDAQIMFIKEGATECLK